MGNFHSGVGFPKSNAPVNYIYDCMRVVQERTGGSPQVSYTRGSDLSGSLEGAGGIGGLLARSHGYSSGNWSTHNCYHADGNGNITYLVNSSQGLAAKYRYDPYGNTISSSGSLASANVYRFSSKEFHVNSGLYYYGYRWYDPNLQRWLNRDPIYERGGINLYGFVANDPVNILDLYGLQTPVEIPQVGKHACEAALEIYRILPNIRDRNRFFCDEDAPIPDNCPTNPPSPPTKLPSPPAKQPGPPTNKPRPPIVILIPGTPVPPIIISNPPPANPPSKPPARKPKQR